MNADIPALEVIDLKVRLGASPILRGINLRVERGTTVALVGPNGAGKTTTLRALMGLLPSEGEVRVAGRSLDGLAAHARARRGIGYAPEDRRLITALNVEDNLWLPAQACGLKRDEANGRFAFVLDLLPELVELRSRWTSTLSGGQQKIVALGRALMAADNLLLLDEPFQGLAPALAHRFGQALRRLGDSGGWLSILVTESNPTLVSSLAQQVYTLERGEPVTWDRGN